MNSRLSFFPVVLAVATLVAACIGGCRRGPKAVPMPTVNAKKASQKAMELFDQDADGLLDVGELAQSPSLKYALKRLDTNGDQKASAEEIKELINSWNEKRVGLLSLRCTVLLDGKPLRAAEVRLEPAPFLVDRLQAARGKTDEFGDANLSVPKENRPIADAPPGVQLGLYRVVISKLDNGKELVPVEYNVKTTLGQEVSFDDPGVANGIVYKLKG